jgi:tetratricopeptide (TPR) repeat protein
MLNRFKAKLLCRRVVDEIFEYQLVNENEIFEILHKYRWVHKVIPYTPVDGPLGEFHRIYKELLKLSKYLLEKPNAKKAFEDYASIINKNDKAIIEWLLNYEQLGKFLTKLYIDTFISDPAILLKGYEKLFTEFPLRVGVIDFYPLLDFIDTFTSHYSLVLEKYHNPEGDGIHYINDVEYYEAKEVTLLDFIAPALKMPIEEVFKNHKEPFEVKRLKHLVPFKAYQRTSPSPQLQKAHDLFHNDQYAEAIELYKELLVTRNDLDEAKAGLAISYFILEEYDMAETVATSLSPYQYKELITLITKFKSGLHEGGLNDTKSYDIVDRFCEEALEMEAGDIDRDYWIKENEDLFKSVSIAPEGLPSIANANFNGCKYKYIYDFHSKYVQRKFEQDILNRMTHKDAVEYFISRMDIYALDKILDYREYSDVDKPFFLEKLNIVFDTFKERGNVRLVCTNGICKGCKNGHIGVAFVGDNDDTYIELMILSENDKVTDIFECNNFKFDTYNKELLGQRLFLSINGGDEFPF